MSDPINQSIASLRREYSGRSLTRQNLDPSPMRQFSLWFQEAVASETREPNAMTLATTGLDGGPTARIVLMKEFSEAGLTFFTNYESRKAREMEACPSVALLFFWRELERQVHVRGRVEKVTRDVSRQYFYSRPYDARIGAWASRQSEEIPNRNWLSERVAEMEKAYPDTGSPDCVPLPDGWGGYLVVPDSVEFWQGQPGRKHDRFVYRKEGSGWTLSRLSP